MTLPKTNEELLALMQLAFKAGQNSMEAKIEYSNYDDVDNETITFQKYGFKYWANKIWKYGKTNTLSE